MSSVPNILVMQESDNNDALTWREFQHFVRCCCICFSTAFVSADVALRNGFEYAYFLLLWLLT